MFYAYLLQSALGLCIVVVVSLGLKGAQRVPLPVFSPDKR